LASIIGRGKLSELSLIKDIQHEPLAILVVISVVVLKIIEITAKYILRGKVMPLRDWQKLINDSLTTIGAKIETIFTTLSAHEYLLDKTSEGTLENQLFTESFSPFMRLKAFRRLLAMGKNGRIWEKGLLLILENKKIIIVEGKRIEIDVWMDVLDTELGIPIVNKEYYEARLKEIRRRIYDDHSEK
jgi:uncharacterized protein Smg (DUF494 family)